MSISYSEVEKSELLKKAAFYGAKEFVHVNVDLGTGDQNPFPRDYKIPSCFMPKKYSTMGERILNYQVRSDDIWLSTFPKAGTTWTFNIILQLMNNIDLSTKFIHEIQLPLDEAAALDLNSENMNDEFYRQIMENADQRLDAREKLPSPRIMKTHLPAHLMPKDIWTVKPKLIYVYRDARDVACSMYHMWRNGLHLKYEGTIEDYFDLFLNDHVVWGPFYEHIDSYQLLEERDHILILNFEEMLDDTFGAVKKISEFLNYTYSDVRLKQLADHVSFQNMRAHYKTLGIFPPEFK